MTLLPTGLPADPAGNELSGSHDIEAGAMACEPSSLFVVRPSDSQCGAEPKPAVKNWLKHSMEEFNSWKKNLLIHPEVIIFCSFSNIHIADILCQNHLLSEVEKLKGKIHTIMILPHALLQKRALFLDH